MMLWAVALVVFVVLCTVLQQLVKRMQDNTKVWGDRYVNFTATTWLRAGPPIQRAWINESVLPSEDVTPRYGRGWLVRVLPTVAINVGRWEAWDEDERLEDADLGELPPIKEWKSSLKRVA